DIIVDTSQMSANQLRDKIRTTFLGMEKQKALFITVLSFGYKYGTPSDADLVIDVRFLPNPHYIEELCQLNGQEAPVRKFVMERLETKDFITKFFDFLEFLLPHYLQEGKSYLTIALGCTGGMHRSVTLTEETGKFLQKKGYNVVVRHRDINKDIENNEG
ncbi:MAG TPA: RNase adaptor protein RapZ, partial [Actinobacteria bacterium]|nr:RNase adaptor protein RapZ [Actinomycetes bacterium]HEX21472.1 RNase adaptor protein RapZ [Actinomycetota bacterium]